MCIRDRQGLRCKLVLGKFADLAQGTNQSIGLDSFLMGAILIMGIYHITLYLLNRQHRAPVYFAALCILIGARLSVTSEGILYRAGVVNWHQGTFLEYFTFYLSMPAFMLFLRSLYPDETHLPVVRISVVVGILGAGLVIALPVFYYAQTLPVFQAWAGLIILYFAVTIARAVLHRRCLLYTSRCV